MTLVEENSGVTMEAEKQSLIDAAKNYLQEYFSSSGKALIPKNLVQKIIAYYAKHQENLNWPYNDGHNSLSTVISCGRIRFRELSMKTFKQFKNICSIRDLVRYGNPLEESRFDDLLFMALFERRGWACVHDAELTELLREETVAKTIKKVKNASLLSSETECQRLFIKLYLNNSTNYQKHLHNGKFALIFQNSSELAQCLLESLFRDIEKRSLSAELVVDIMRIFQGLQLQLPPSTETYKRCFQSAFCGDITMLLETFADFDKTNTWPVEYTYMMEELLLTSLSTIKSTNSNPIWQTIKITATSNPKTFAKCLRSFCITDHCRFNDRDEIDIEDLFEGLYDLIDLAHLLSINREFSKSLALDEAYFVAFCERLTTEKLQEFFESHTNDTVYARVYSHSRQLFYSLLRRGAFMRHGSTTRCKYHVFQVKPDDTNLDVVMKQYLREEVDRGVVMQCMIMGLIPEIARNDFIERVEKFHGSGIPEYPESLRYLLPLELAELPAPKKTKITRKKKDSNEPSALSYILPLESIMVVPIDMVNTDNQVANYVKAVLWHYTKNGTITAADLTPQLNMLLLT